MTALLGPAVAGTLRYEALMALRRRAVWYTLLPLSLLALVMVAGAPASAEGAHRAGDAALKVSLFCLPGVAAAFVDRLARGNGGGMGELLAAAPFRGAAHLVARLAAPLAVALLPLLLVMLAAGALGAVEDGGAAPLGAALLGFAVVVMPGAAAGAAFGALAGLLMPPVLARVAAVLAWCWATIATPRFSPVPTPTGTLLSPLGGYPGAAWLGQPEVLAHRFLDGPLSPPVGTGTALLNLAAVAGTTALFVAAAGLLLAGRR